MSLALDSTDENYLDQTTWPQRDPRFSVLFQVLYTLSQRDHKQAGRARPTSKWVKAGRDPVPLLCNSDPKTVVELGKYASARINRKTASSDMLTTCPRKAAELAG